MGKHLRTFRGPARVALLLFLAATGAPGPASAEAAAGPLTVYLVRHAEKEAGDNPSLSAAGRARVAALLRRFEDTVFSALFATETCRTVLTLQPLARKHGLAIQIQGDDASAGNLNSCTPAVTVMVEKFGFAGGGLVARLQRQRGGGPVLVAGHSNTLPEILRALGAPCGEGFCAAMADSEYSNLFEVTLPNEGPVQARRLTYGAGSGTAHDG